MLKDTYFHWGVEDFAAGLPPRDFGFIGASVPYEFGRLFAAHCRAQGLAVPELPSHGDRRQADFRDALRQVHQALMEDSFPWLPRPLG